MRTKYRYKRGLGLMEIVVGTAIISMSLVGLVTAFNVFVRAGLSNTNKTQATYIMEEGIEALRYLRDGGWSSNISSLSKGTPYYFTFDGSNWGTTITKALIDNKFDRTVVLKDVYRRNSDDDIVDISSGDPKTLDPDTIQATVDVSWSGSGIASGNVNATLYLTNFFDN